MRTGLLTVLETLFVLAALYGVAMVHVPTALILGGVLGVVAVERRAAEVKAAADAKGGDA